MACICSKMLLKPYVLLSLLVLAQGTFFLLPHLLGGMVYTGAQAVGQLTNVLGGAALFCGGLRSHIRFARRLLTTSTYIMRPIIQNFINFAVNLHTTVQTDLAQGESPSKLAGVYSELTKRMDQIKRMCGRQESAEVQREIAVLATKESWSETLTRKLASTSNMIVQSVRGDQNQFANDLRVSESKRRVYEEIVRTVQQGNKMQASNCNSKPPSGDGGMMNYFFSRQTAQQSYFGGCPGSVDVLSHQAMDTRNAFLANYGSANIAQIFSGKAGMLRQKLKKVQEDVKIYRTHTPVPRTAAKLIRH